MDLKNNSLEKEINELLEICNRLKGADASWFKPPATEEGILDWERTNGITIPESYKEWLRFSDNSQILGHAALLLGVKEMVVSNKHVPDDLVIIGHMVGDGELLCFSKESGKIVRYLDGDRNEFDSFKAILLELIEDGKSELGEDEATNSFGVMMLKLLEDRKKSGKALTEGEEQVLVELQALARGEK